MSEEGYVAERSISGVLLAVVTVALLAGLGGLVWCYGLQNHIAAGIHYAKHGEPNGVILASGEFIHTRPHGMKKLRLEVGSSVSASGELRSTVLGTLLLEADEVNRMKME